ncbi:4'-phosphopantetheinyl transferase superfamily protein [Phreatobacter aquaticus]|uniref:4'-phosphopantetheinyl transferase superfamily protein n=1 Tax=Phreatobacter aquaticus TaxID=2570229 RepID=A0A4D7QD84_9HYPH|nr:4'-phosphopantetheinyl transferase superfamily protein [Phreatobacter aquaticus]QCK84381.1 4'-phosphopantetheinyl transferase superfamily protein [Phreatobacter aquaticus]
MSSAGQVDIAVAAVDRLPTDWHDLEPFEYERIARLMRADDRAAYAMAHGLLRRLISGVTGLAAADIRLAYRPGGQPFLAGAPEGFGISLSHSRDVVAVAVGRGVVVGIDVERPRDLAQDSSLLSSVLSPAERITLDAVDPTRREALFLRYWTLKEAILKATGEGITRRALQSLSLAHIALAEESLPRAEIGGLPGTWHLAGGEIDGGVWSLAVEGDGGAIALHRREAAALLA